MTAAIQDTSRFAGPGQVRRLSRTDAQAELVGRQAKAGAHFEDGRSLFAQTAGRGAHAVPFQRKPHTDPLRMWAKKLIDRKPFKLVAVALANKMARIAFAILRGKTVYREIPA
jgi:transposase